MSSVITDWPRLNAKVWLRLPCCAEEHPTRVENFAGEQDCVVATPSSPHGTLVGTEGLEDGFFLVWDMNRGSMEVPVGLVEATEDRVPVWRVRSLGPAVETQRRRFVRIDVATEAALYLVPGGAPSHVATVSVGEGGISCRVDRWAIDPRDKVFVTELFIGGEIHTLRSKVAWWGSMDIDDRRPVGIEFIDVDARVGDKVRAWVFTQQLKQRKFEV
jgi:hypothetical protein